MYLTCLLGATMGNNNLKRVLTEVGDVGAGGVSEVQCDIGGGARNCGKHRYIM